jgi:uncharacterized membrane protein YdjX (TVP38/TMEM64 family)
MLTPVDRVFMIAGTAVLMIVGQRCLPFFPGQLTNLITIVLLRQTRFVDDD